MTGPSQRPPLSDALTGAELQRWYWLREELALLARGVGVSPSGSKDLLTRRLAAHLDGRPFTEVTRSAPATGDVRGPLSPSSVIPRGQRCTQRLRAWFVEQVGPTFRFDAAMRAFLSEGDGTRTLQDALDHWALTRGGAPEVIGEQFEYNRFTRRWHEEHPGGAAADARAAWWEHRGRPVEERRTHG